MVFVIELIIILSDLPSKKRKRKRKNNLNRLFEDVKKLDVYENILNFYFLFNSFTALVNVFTINFCFFLFK